MLFDFCGESLVVELKKALFDGTLCEFVSSKSGGRLFLVEASFGVEELIADALKKRFSKRKNCAIAKFSQAIENEDVDTVCAMLVSHGLLNGKKHRCTIGAVIHNYEEEEIFKEEDEDESEEIENAGNVISAFLDKNPNFDINYYLEKLNGGKINLARLKMEIKNGWFDGDDRGARQLKIAI